MLSDPDRDDFQDKPLCRDRGWMMRSTQGAGGPTTTGSVTGYHGKAPRHRVSKSQGSRLTVSSGWAAGRVQPVSITPQCLLTIIVAGRCPSISIRVHETDQDQPVWFFSSTTHPNLEGVSGKLQHLHDEQILPPTLSWHYQKNLGNAVALGVWPLTASDSRSFQGHDDKPSSKSLAKFWCPVLDTYCSSLGSTTG